MVKIVGYSHLWIALGALCSALATMHAYAPLALQDVSTWGIATAIGLGTGVLYTLQRRIKWARMPQNMPVDRRQFIEKWFEWVMGIWMVGGLIWLVIFWDGLLPWLTALAGGWPVLLVLLALVSGYASNPFLNQGNGWRDVSRMKLPVIAITWGLATVWVPGVMSGEGPWEVNLIVRAIAQSTFIAGLTIPFRCARLADRPSGNEYRAPAHRAAKSRNDRTLAHSVERLFFHGGWECRCTDGCRRMCDSLGRLRSFCARRVAVQHHP